ncbi:hypothetical protein, partial [Caldanaerobacter sp.]|uniref:hypothetical protein n=1 Tax=Caldanaerobacter sp. TaxID=2930036 RepID=UPI003C77E1C6
MVYYISSLELTRETKDLTTAKRFDIIKELLINRFLRDLEKWTARQGKEVLEGLAGEFDPGSGR